MNSAGRKVGSAPATAEANRRAKRGRGWTAVPLTILGLMIGSAALGSPVYPGDPNHDGAVNVADAIMALRMALHFVPVSAADLASADVAPMPGADGRAMGDGKVTIADAIRILQYAVGLISSKEFFGPHGGAWDDSLVTLQIDASAMAASVFSGDAPHESTLSVELIGADKIAGGSIILEVSPLNGAPPLKILRVDAGSLLGQGMSLETNPSPLPPGGVTRLRAGFALFGQTPITGSGEIFRFTVKPSAPVPQTARYRFAASLPDFTTDDAITVQVPDVEAVLTHP